MVVLRCCLGEFFLYFIGAVVLGFLVCWFLRLPGKSSRRMGLSLAAAYVVFELFASAVYQGRLPGLWAVMLGIACLGLALGALLHWLLLTIRCRTIGDKKKL